MDNARLRRLFERVIAPGANAANECPDEEKLAGLVAGSLLPEERSRMEESLNRCPGCREEVEQLQSASQWFARNEDAVFAELLQKMAAAGVEPWASWPSAVELELFLSGAVPAGPSGDRLRRRVEKALAESPSCRALAEKIRAAMAAIVILKAAELQNRADQASLAAVRGLLLALRAMAAGRGRAARAVPGFRDAVAPTLSALLLDPAGQAVLDDQGRPLRIEVHVVRAELETDGRFVLDLSLAPAAGRATPQPSQLAAALEHEQVRLVLPPAKVYPDGRATIVGRLPAGIEIKELPLESLRLRATAAP